MHGAPLSGRMLKLRPGPTGSLIPDSAERNGRRHPAWPRLLRLALPLHLVRDRIETANSGQASKRRASAEGRVGRPFALNRK